MIYCIGNLDHGLCKIGFTNNTAKRLENLQVGSAFRLTLFGCVEGNREVEKRLHKLFHNERTYGEWFVITARVAHHFGFDMEPQQYLWAVALTHAEGSKHDCMYHNDMCCVFASDATDAVARGRLKLNLPGNFLRGDAMQVPESDMRQAVHRLNEGQKFIAAPVTSIFPERKQRYERVRVVKGRNFSILLSNRQRDEMLFAEDVRETVIEICTRHGEELPENWMWQRIGHKLMIDEVTKLD